MSAHKYHAKPKVVDGIRYASTAEADYVADVLLWEQSGGVTDVERQPKVTLVAGIIYHPDVAMTFTKNGQRVWVEVKGAMTDRFRLIMKLWRHSGPGPLWVVQRKSRKSGFRTIREIPGGGA